MGEYMSLVQILDCSGEIGNCCNDYSLVILLDTLRKIFNLIQLIVPIILIIMSTIGFIQLMIDPEKKGGIKSIINKYIAAGIIFFLPVLLDAVMGVIPQKFEMSACFKSAKMMSEIVRISPAKYSPYKKKEKKKILYDGEYEKSHEGSSSSSSKGGVGAKKIVNIALGELGNNEGNNTHHKYEAYNGLDDSQAWCAAFVTWCAGQAGYVDKGVFPKFVGCETGFSLFKQMGADIHLASSGYNPKEGDIIFFSWTGNSSLDHVGIVLGYDNEYVYTIEGNTTCDGEAASKCGGSDGVSKKARNRNNTIYAFVTPHYGS